MTPQSVVYNVVAVGTTNLPTTSSLTNGSFNPGVLPLPTVDYQSIANGQYFALTQQTNENWNGVWYADPAGPVAVNTVGGPGGLNPNIVVIVGPAQAGSGGQNGGTTWVYAAVSHNGGPGLVQT